MFANPDAPVAKAFYENHNKKGSLHQLAEDLHRTLDPETGNPTSNSDSIESHPRESFLIQCQHGSSGQRVTVLYSGKCGVGTNPLQFGTPVRLGLQASTGNKDSHDVLCKIMGCLLYTSPSPRDS